jgi:hypothetical protein
MRDRFYYSETPSGIMIVDTESNNSCHILEEFLIQYEPGEGRETACLQFRNLLLDSWRVGIDNLAMTVTKAGV